MDRIALGPTQKQYRWEGLLFTHKSGIFGAISVTARRCYIVNRHISDKFLPLLAQCEQEFRP